MSANTADGYWSQVSDSWDARVHLKWRARIYSGATPSRDNGDYWSFGSVPWIGSGAVGQGVVTEPTALITDLAIRETSTKFMRRGALVIALAGQGKTKGTVAELGIDCYGNQSLSCIDPGTDDERFLYWWLTSLYRQIRGLASDDSRDGLNQEMVGSIPVPIVPLVAQRAIAAYLDRETKRIDGLVAEKELMLSLLDEKRAALISRVVTRGLNEDAPLKVSGLEWVEQVPAHWVVCQLKRTWCSSDYGLSESIRDEGEIAVLRMSCIVDGRVDAAQSGRIGEVDGRLLLQRDDLLFNRTNSLDQIAKVGLVDFDPEQPLTFASYLVRIRANAMATPQFLALLLNSSIFLAYARKNAIPAIGQANLSPTRYGEIHVPVPPLDEQEAIVLHLRQEAERIEPVRAALLRSIQLLKDRRTSLITEAVTGQIPLEEMTA